MGFPAQSIILMTDDAEARRKPDRVNIMRVLRTFTANINENSEVVFFFSGHGVRAANFDYLAPLDAMPPTCQTPAFPTTSCVTIWKANRRAVV